MDKPYKTTEFFDYLVFCDSLKNIDITDCHNLVISTINPHSYVIAKKDKVFKKALLTSDILLPDGIGVIYSIKYIYKKKIIKIAGYDLLIHLLEYLNTSNSKCFFIGATNDVLVSITNRIQNEYTNIRVGSYSPPFKTNFNKNDNEVMISSITDFKPDIIFVGMTAPKQERWVYLNKSKLNAKAICSIGAAFDFYAGAVNRPSRFWVDRGFEWFARFCNNPVKMWKRIFISIPIFVCDTIRQRSQQSKKL